MKRGRPQDFDHELALAGRRSSVGRAHRQALVGGRELWRLPADAEPVARRLRALGARGIGGFVDAGLDEQGPWLVRSGHGDSLEDWLGAHRGPRAWTEVAPPIMALCRCLIACETDSLFPGPLRPEQVWVDPGCDPPRVALRADALVESLLGVTGAQGRSAPGLSRWLPPEQADGAPWDNGANRYVLGLVLYRALAGEHPFAGKGMRLALSEEAHRGAPPLPPAIARSLPPGLQSLCLRLLDPDPRARPGRASEILEQLERLSSIDPSLGAAPRPNPAGSISTPRPSASARPAAPSKPLPRWGHRLGRAVVALAPWAIAWMVVSSLDLGPSEPERPAKVLPVEPRAPLSSATTRPDDCARCHPEQTAQWHGSVMAHSVKSPLFQGLEMLIEEQVGRRSDCPDGAGILRSADPATACRDPQSGLPVTGSGGELWCVNCHAPGENLGSVLPDWDGRGGQSSSRQPLADLLPASTLDGISCAFCHQVHGPVQPGNERLGRYEGNPSWTSTKTGLSFSMRPEDGQGQPGIANSGYALDPSELLLGLGATRRGVPAGAHARPSAQARDYLRSSEFCGGCHDVRLFGTDAIAVRRGEHFKRLRNAYTEWRQWAQDERRAGREPASCQDCHMSTFPGVCEPGESSAGLEQSFGTFDTALHRACPDGTTFVPRAPGSKPPGPGASTHYFTGVDVPLTPEFPLAMIDDPTLDAAGIPRGARQRRDLLLGSTFRFELADARTSGGRLEIPIEIENVGAGHKVPAGFSQEREIWVHLKVTDARGTVVYEVGRVDRPDQDLSDKVFVRINVDDRFTDGDGAPLGVFGADVRDGPDVPEWSPDPLTGATKLRGKGLLNLQNGFSRCVRCIGFIDDAGRCQALPGQEDHRAARFADGDYDPDTGECRSNLRGELRFFETYFPVGALDARRGVVRGPDAIIDTRSAPPGVPLRYTYDLPVGGGRGPFRVEARLLFRAFPPFLVRAFADYEAQQEARGLRPSGALVTHDMLDRLEVVELHRAEVTVP